MTFLKSSHKVISLILAIALVMTMFVGIAPTNVMATGTSGSVGNSGTVGESNTELIQINIENLTLNFAQTSPYATKEPYELFIVGEDLPNITTADFTFVGEGAENVTITDVSFNIVDDAITGKHISVATSPVQAGKWYTVEVFLTANDGYQLYGPNMGVIEDDMYVSKGFPVYACVNSSKEIVAIDFNYIYGNDKLLPTYEAGETIPTISNAGDTTQKVIYVNYASRFPYSFSEGNIAFKELGETIDNTRYWYSVTTSTFVAGKTYAVSPVLEAVDGYTFNCENKGGWVNEDDTTKFQCIWNLGVCPAKTSNALNGQLATAPAVTSVTDLTDDEQDAVTNGATARLDVSIKTETPPTADKTVADNKISEEKLTVAQYLDIDLNLVIGAYTRALTDLKVPVTVQITVPTQYRKVNREFSIIRVHDGIATKITPKSYNQYTGILAFETDKFSTYALAYEDKAIGINPTIVGGGSAHIHTYKYSFNKDGHWQNCSCGLGTIEEKHSFNTNGTCTVCGYNKNNTSTSSEVVPNPSTGGRDNIIFVAILLVTLAIFVTTNAISRKKHSK